MMFLTSDLYDDNEDTVQVMRNVFLSFGAKSRFYGQCVTVKLFEDNSQVKAILNEDGKGKVLVVDGGGSIRVALMGDLIAKAACQNGWEGVVIWGAIRDSLEINQLNLGVRALKTTPKKSVRRGEGQRDLDLHMLDVHIAPKDWIYIDDDGILISKTPLKLD